MTSTIRASDWHAYDREADNTEVVVTKLRPAGTQFHHITSLEASYDGIATGLLDLYGLNLSVGPMDLTSTSVLNLTTDIFAVTDHGLAEDQKVVFYTTGTAPTGLTSGNTYYVIRTNANSFQLESTLGGGAVDMSGTQANFGTDAQIIPLSKSWQVYDSHGSKIISPWKQTSSQTPIIVKLSAVASTQGIINLSGYSI